MHGSTKYNFWAANSSELIQLCSLPSSETNKPRLNIDLIFIPVGSKKIG